MDNRTMITEIDTKEKLIIDRELKNQLMKDLSPDDLSKIKRGFDLYRGVVDLKQFIIIILYALYPQVILEKRKAQILTFIEIFILIDLKNLRKIKFQDFTNYLIDRQSSQAKAEESQFFPAQDLNQLNLQADIVFPLANSKLLAVLQNSKKNIYLLQQKSYKVAQHISFGGTIINNIIYIPDQEIYCIATNDKHLNFYQSSDNSLVRRFSTPDSITHMIYFKQSKKIITASTNGRIYEWSSQKILANMKKKQKNQSQREKLPKVPAQQQYKLFMLNKILKDQDDLTCLDILGSLQILITGSNDSKIRLYQIRQTGLKLNKQLDGHYKGIKGLTVSVHHKVIVSCSFDFDVLVWNAYLQHPVARLQGHQAPLASVYCPKEHQIIISIDSKSIMKIWNSQKYHLIQNILVLQNNPNNSAIRLCYKEESNLAIIYTKKLYFYKYAVNYNPRLTDDQDITAIKYSPKNLQVYIGSLKSLKVWSIQTGVQKRNYLNIVQSQITVIEIDQRDRRCFIGCMDGKIASLDLFSGLIIQKYSSHKNQISFLLYNNQHNLLISGSWDKKIKIHNDTHHLQRIQSRQNVLRNIFNVSEKDLYGGSFSVEQLLIATHCKTNTFVIWDFEKGHLEAKYLLPSDICLLQFIRPFPLIIVSDIKGSIYIFSTKNYIPNPFALLAQWKSMYSIQKTSQINFIKPFYNDKTKECEVILGDEYGYIRIINITGFLQENNIVPVTPELIGNKNPYRIQDYYYKGVSQLSTMTHDFTKSNDPNLIPPTSIKQRIQIKAHNQRINYVTLVNQSQQPLILSSSADHMVKLWNLSGQLRGTLRQGQRVNNNWGYSLNEKWQNIECKLYKQIKGSLQGTQQDYLFKKRVDMIPFTQAQRFEQITNNDIYQTLKEIDKYTQKGEKKQLRY